MKNRSLLKILYSVLVAGLIVSCMGMEEGDPSSLQVPEVKSFEVKDNGSLIFELTASVDKSLAGRIAECGFYYGKEKSMSGAEKIECKMLSGTFSAEITLHEYGETFYVCNYISNGTEGNEICSEVKSITVKELQDYVEFGQAALVSYDRATKAASVSVSYEVEKGIDVTARGLCYGTSSELSVKGSTLKDENLSSGSVTYEIPGVETGKTYYVRPYLYDGEELAYGQVQELHAYAVPVVETAEVTDVTYVSAVCGGNVTDDGGSEIIANGIVWSASKNSTVNMSAKTDCCNELRDFSSSITGLKPGTQYYVRAYATNAVGTSYGEERTFKTPGDPLDFMDAANCFIVSYPGTYRFLVVKGNSSELVGTVKSVEVLWESFGTSSIPSVGSLVNSVSCTDYYITFQVPSTFKEGNAVIAAKNASGTILWSWHIWLTDQPGECVYTNNAGTMMDRNLGATSAAPGSVGALGLLYQWGRKDPFLGSSSISSSIESESTIIWPSPVSSNSNFGTVAYATEHPTTFICSSDMDEDWHYSIDSSSINTHWKSKKTIYDPCPAGWRVPDGGRASVWVKAGIPDTYTYDSVNKGMLFGPGISSPATWYPTAGLRYYRDGHLYNVDYSSLYWAVDTNDEWSYDFGFSIKDNVHDGYYRCNFVGNARSVRCLQE